MQRDRPSPSAPLWRLTKTALGRTGGPEGGGAAGTTVESGGKEPPPAGREQTLLASLRARLDTQLLSQSVTAHPPPASRSRARSGKDPGGEDGSVPHPLRARTGRKNQKQTLCKVSLVRQQVGGEGLPGRAPAVFRSAVWREPCWCRWSRGPAGRDQPERTDFEALCSFRPWPLLDRLPNVLPPELEA